MTSLDLRCHFGQDDLCFHASRQTLPIMNALMGKGLVFKCPPKNCGQHPFLSSLDYQEDIPFLALHQHHQIQSPEHTLARAAETVQKFN